MIITCVLIAYVVRKDIEKKYKEELNFGIQDFFGQWGFATKYTNLAGCIVLNYLDAKNIIRNKLYKTNVYNPLIKLKTQYNVLEEKERNIMICFMHFISPFICAIIGGGLFVIFKYILNK